MTKILTILLLAFLCISQIPAEEYENLALHRFCRRKCLRKGKILENDMCDCSSATTPNEAIFNHIEEDNIEFRNYMLKTINDFRQKAAKGELENFPPASRMLLLNYDVSLEFVSYCKLRKLNVESAQCVRTKYDHQPGKTKFSTLGPTKKGFMKTMDGVRQEMEEFHKQVVKLTVNKTATYEDMKIAFPWKPSVHHRNLYTLLYDIYNRVGCARASIENTKYGDLREIITCHFGVDQVNGYLGLQDKVLLYKEGEPCSRCNYYDLNCSTTPEYNALCGELKPVPEYGWKYGPVPHEPWLVWSANVTTGHSTKIEVSLLLVSALFVTLFTLN